MDTDKVKLTPLEQFIKTEQPHLKANLAAIIDDLKKDMAVAPKEYIEPGCEEPSIDIRLCIDSYSTNSNPFSLVSDLEQRFEWLFRTGDASYDPRHSKYCGASSVGLDSSVIDVLLELVDEVLEQEAMLS